MEEELISSPLEEYAEACSEAEPEALYDTWRRSNLHLVGGRMCSGHLQGRLLKMLVKICDAKRILELGTFSGYATACLAEGAGPEGKVISIERHEELTPFINRTLRDTGMEERVEVLFGDALQLMREMPSGGFDMMFIDADKKEYPAYYQEARRLVRRGGMILADNTLWYGHVIDPSYGSDPSTSAIREFNRMAASDEGVETVLLPLRDGLTLIRVR